MFKDTKIKSRIRVKVNMCFLDVKIVSLCGERARWLCGRASNSGARGPGFEPQDRHIVSFKLSKVLVNTQEAVAPSQHD